MANVRNGSPMSPAERQRRYRARQSERKGGRGANDGTLRDIGKVAPGPKTARSTRLGEATVSQLVNELVIALHEAVDHRPEWERREQLRWELRRAGAQLDELKRMLTDETG